MPGGDFFDNALASLIRDHQIISNLIDSLSAYALRLLEPSDVRVEPRDLGAFARVLRGFADELHHEKEEEILQPILSRRGFHWEDGLLAEVRSEHERERYLIDVLEQAAECELAWTAEDRRSISATALALVTFQREHMAKENRFLFPEVARRLSNEALEALRGQLERFEQMPRHEAIRSELLGVADDLMSRYPAAVRMSRDAGGGLRLAADPSRTS